MKKIIIAGGRDFGTEVAHHLLMEDAVDAAINPYFGEIKQFLSGKAKGADTVGEEYALNQGYHVKDYPADWAKYGKSAGYKRNEQMAKDADVLVAFWDGTSKGTKHMIDIALRERLVVHVFPYGEKS